MSIKILILEDELSIRSFIKIKLKNLGYEVTDVGTGTEALDKIDDSFSVALLDIMLPDIDGIQVCKNIRAFHPNIGIIMLTAKGQEQDKILGLKSGADDYIVKPFSLSELVARIEAILRRINHNNDISSISSGPFTLNLDKKLLTKDKQEIPLTPTEFSIIEFLMKNPDKSISRDAILDYVWGKNYVGDTKTVDVNIRRLRQKIETNASNPKYIITSWGYGYIWSNKND
ncbi:response regulator transcription factor [Hathewaya limosa]|uniref:Stage 0 sporulation protein A homolog n=1 Tax=Hathewaya limosa TaxID=1536 RepID=A0ABU0JNH2_HATLI|nr:response regulator transcription factor [Hathewaya limosa]MDQ0478623.1 DNA-binding response OmpR family regulator [Hathewaya limosa]